jgi:hypothetical protein
MKSKFLIVCLAGVLLLFGLSVPGMTQEDSADIAVSYATAYPGTGKWLEVQMKNPMEVAGYNFYLVFSNPDLARFCQDDTGACMVSSGGPAVWCECFDSPCVYVHTWNTEVGIPPNPNYQTLFSICVRTCCIPDSTTDRCALILLQGELSDEEGNLLPFRYHQGELTLWWIVPGDINADSLVAIADAVYLVNYLYREGPEPCACESADVNGDCVISLGDLIYLLNYLFRQGGPPLPGCQVSVPCPHEDCWPE